MPKPVADWPLLLAGPMLRTVTPTSVSVFVALKHSRKVRVSVLPPGTSPNPLGQAEVDARRLGAYLHVALVTVTLGTPAAPGLLPNRIYRYEVTLTASGTRDTLDTGPATHTLGSLGLLTGPVGLGYAEGALPSFALPPADLNDLKIAHGSCRKPHGQNRDAFPILDTIIRATRSDPVARPHQLFLTGDQIYADDVAEPLLNELTPTGEALLGWGTPERCPGLSTPPAQIRPGNRAAVVVPPLTSDEAGSHLMTLGEFYAMYLFAWSDALWPATLPVFGALPPAEQARYGSGRQGSYDARVASISRFRNSLGKVRRALANVPTYCIFDDHEITDDWFLHRRAKNAAATHPVANRIVVNGLAAYAVFQAWGNTPEQFAPAAAIGSRLLDWLRDWRGETDSTFAQIQGAVQVPESAGGGLRWDYEYVGPEHHVIVLNSRTQRGYPSGDDRGAADLLMPAAIQQQIVARRRTPNKRVTILVAPAPVCGHWLHEGAAHSLGWVGAEAFGDRETWLVRHRPMCFESLLGALAPLERVVILSGDVHYGFAFKVHYWDERQAPERRATFVQFTSSALKNEDWKTRDLGAAPWGSDVALGGGGPLISARRAGFLGWDTPGGHVTGPDGLRSVEGTPAIQRVPEYGVTAVVDPPRWRYRTEMLTDTRTAVERGVPATEVTPAQSGWFNRAVAWAANHGRVAKYDQMRTVVGTNNIATISFDASPPGARQQWLWVHQRLWFRLVGPNDELRPYTTQSVDLAVMPQSAIRPTPNTLGTPIPDLGDWSDLISMRPPVSVQRATRARFGGSLLDWTGHRLESGFGDINLDFYPVRVTTLPQLGGGPLRPEQLLNIIRGSINSLVDPAAAKFDPYDAAVDGPLWTSSAALGAVISIHVYPYGADVENGSVVVTSFRPDRWVFSTLWTPNDLGHPVSGNRAFGFVRNEDGSHTFYTRGADRPTGIMDYAFAQKVFEGADRLWVSLQDGIVNYVRSNQGMATKEARLSTRYPWPEVSSVYWRPVEDWIK